MSTGKNTFITTIGDKLKRFLTRLAKKHLDLTDKEFIKKFDMAVANFKRDTFLTLEKEKRVLEKIIYEKDITVRRLDSQIARMKAKYPTVWLNGNVAQGVVQLPKLKLACEFFREENKLCVFAPWSDAAGKKPREFVPDWLEVDENQKIECIMDRLDKSGVLYKIPVKGWDDTMDLERTGSQPNYSLDGKTTEKTRSFRNKVNGTFRRELDKNDQLWCHLWFHEFDLPYTSVVNAVNISSYLPKGNMKCHPGRDWYLKTYGEAPDRIFYFKVPVIEELTPQIGYNKRTYIAPNPGIEPLELTP